MEEENINNGQPENGRERKYDNDNITKKLYNNLTNCHIVFHNINYKNSGLIEGKKKDFKSIEDFKKSIQNEKMEILYDIKKKDDKVKSSLSLKYYEVCQYIAFYEIYKKTLEDDKFKYLKGFENYNDKIFHKMDSKEKNICLCLMLNNFQKGKGQHSIPIFEVKK